MPLDYHAEQLAVQDEANTRALAGRLAYWAGPFTEFALGADLFVLASPGADGALRFSVFSGPAPLVRFTAPQQFALETTLPAHFHPGQPFGCLAINLSNARRVRLNGQLVAVADGLEFGLSETFTHCRKYIPPSVSTAGHVLAGPRRAASLALDDPGITNRLACAELAFVATTSPAGLPTVSMRAGPPGFLSPQKGKPEVSWPEYVGEGVFQSAGNIRANRRMALLVPDIEDGSGLELAGTAAYRNLLTHGGVRLEPLLQFPDPHPVQGAMRLQFSRALELEGLMHRRVPVAGGLHITSCSNPQEQAPQ